MSASAVVEEVIANLERRYGRSEPFGRSRLLRFGASLTCSINYSKHLRGNHFFFGLAQEVVDDSFAYPETSSGEFVLLACGAADRVLVLPRALVQQMMRGVATRKLDVFCEGESLILQTTQHPKLDVTGYVNAFPAPWSSQGESNSTPDETPRPTREHVTMQWALVTLGIAEGCSVWVPPADRGLSHGGQPLASLTLDRLPNFGFDENTRRVVQNIDVLWLQRNVIQRAFEVEATTSIYSGLLRLNDLVLAQPNNSIELFIAAQRSRRARLLSQLMRPSFHSLSGRCHFVDFEAISDAVCHINGLPTGVRVQGLLRGELCVVPEPHHYPLDV